MSGRSVWAFTMVSRRRAIVNAQTDQTQIFYRTCEMKQYIERKDCFLRYLRNETIQ